MPLRVAALLLVFVLIAPSAFGASLAVFRDAQDGQLDLSEWLLTRKGALPVATVITEPAVGYGAGLGLIFFHQSIGEKAAETAAAPGAKMLPPSISVAAVAGTENGTRAGGGGHFGSWKNDRIRYVGGAMYIAPNLDYYGAGGTLPPVSYELEGWGIVQELSGRVGGTDLFVGGRYVYGKIDGRFAEGSGIPEADRESTLGGLSATMNWDSRDNILTPTRGLNIVGRATKFADYLGSSRDFKTYDAYAQIYLNPHESLITGVRLDLRGSSGDTPFYAKPYLQMRGLPVMRYLDDVTALAEVEVRWNVHGRWSLVGFGGGGKVGGDFDELQDADSVRAYGTGFRYLLARRLGLHAGIDVARGPDDTAWYIQVGNAWR